MSWLILAAAACGLLAVYIKKKTASAEAVGIRLDLRSEPDIGQITSVVKKAGGRILGIEKRENIVLTVRVKDRDMLYRLLFELADLPFTAAAREIRAD